MDVAPVARAGHSAGSDGGGRHMAAPHCPALPPLRVSEAVVAA